MKRFGDKTVLDGVSLDLDAHQVITLIGPSGSGKSTLLRCLNLLERIDDGQIILAGEDISDPRVKVDAVRARFGVVFQNYNLFPHLSVLDNVTLALRKVHGVPRDAAEKRGLELLDRIGLADKARVHPDQLSGGQQQRVAALAHQWVGAEHGAQLQGPEFADRPLGRGHDHARKKALLVAARTFLPVVGSGQGGVDSNKLQL